MTNATELWPITPEHVYELWESCNETRESLANNNPVLVLEARCPLTMEPITVVRAEVARERGYSPLAYYDRLLAYMKSSTPRDRAMKLSDGHARRFASITNKALQEQPALWRRIKSELSNQ